MVFSSAPSQPTRDRRCRQPESTPGAITERRSTDTRPKRALSAVPSRGRTARRPRPALFVRPAGGMPTRSSARAWSGWEHRGAEIQRRRGGVAKRRSQEILRCVSVSLCLCVSISADAGGAAAGPESAAGHRCNALVYRSSRVFDRCSGAFDRSKRVPHRCSRVFHRSKTVVHRYSGVLDR